MLGIGWTEFILIALVVLLIFGPEKIPEILMKISQVVLKLKDAGRELRSQLDEEIIDIQGTGKEIQKEIVEKVERSYAEVEAAERSARQEAAAKVSVLSAEVKDELKETQKEIEEASGAEVKEEERG